MTQPSRARSSPPGSRPECQRPVGVCLSAPGGRWPGFAGVPPPAHPGSSKRPGRPPVGIVGPPAMTRFGKPGGRLSAPGGLRSAIARAPLVAANPDSVAQPAAKLESSGSSRSRQSQVAEAPPAAAVRGSPTCPRRPPARIPLSIPGGIRPPSLQQPRRPPVGMRRRASARVLLSTLADTNPEFPQHAPRPPFQIRRSIRRRPPVGAASGSPGGLRHGCASAPPACPVKFRLSAPGGHRSDWPKRRWRLAARTRFSVPAAAHRGSPGNTGSRRSGPP